jgi:hypothetical protein
MRVVAWRHGRATHSWADAKVSLTAGFPQLDIAVFQVANLPYSSVALLPHQANLSRWHTDLGIIAFFRQ